MGLSTGVGVLKVKIWYGLDPGTGRWGSPMRQRWGLGAHQEMSPALEDKLAFTVTATRSYEEAAELAQKWNCPVDDSTLHTLTRRLGTRAERQTQARLASVAAELTPQRAASELAVFMLDGYLVRYRGPGWGKKKTQKKRVEWHEIKTGVFYLQEQAARTEGGRGVLSEKVVVCWQGEGVELGRRLHWEALRRGLGRAQWILVLGDGAAWIWNVAADRWADAQELLDFYHAGEHLWELGRALYPEAEVQEWVESRLHELRHGEEEKFLAKIKRLKPRRGEAGKTLREQQNYFANQAGRMHYEEMAQRGWPIGSGAVESACSGKQSRFKRRGQFWTHAGVSHLEALIEARENNHWDELWFAA
ncbi:MAG: hypothetical protein ACLQU3_12860 [Limisphaerales bacterium]